jgi:rod shape determining protein RodA
LVVLPARTGMTEERQEQMLRYMGISPYQKRRIEVFLGLDKDPFGAGWNKRQSEISVGSGGLRGKGFQRGTQNILGYLPRSVAPTDFVFAVIAEETGFMGSAVVLTLFGAVALVGCLAALAARDKLGRLLCAGIVSVLFCHVFINVAMTVGLMPVTGLPLPLLSYGGTFMLVTMSALGIVQSVYSRSHETAAMFEQTGLWKNA